MCGIAGIIAKDTSLVTVQKLKSMSDIIEHRGPDGEGQWISSCGQVGLGHRRLSIIDLSHEADQPMHYLGRYSIVFNGEIYNYLELKETLLKQGYSFKTLSDTEVLMALYDRDKENCLGLLDGMFSFVIYDNKENSAFCARDRFGEKPFFYSYKKGEYFMFGSEMKCLWAGGVAKEVNNRMMFNYLAYGFVSNEQDVSETFFQNCTRLAHAHFITINLTNLEIQEKRYYDIDWRATNPSITTEQAKKTFSELIYTSINRRLRSDVSVGSSLSGGLDSSLIVCAIDELKKGIPLGEGSKQKTFSAVFPGFKKDERKYMDYVIAKTRVEPHFVNPKDEELIHDFEKLKFHQEEPFGSASIYIQYRVMQLAKEHNVTVLLDGQGADELLAGYHYYYIQYFNDLKRSNPALYKKELSFYKQLHQGNDINQSITHGWKNIVKSKFASSASKLRQRYVQFEQLRNPLFNKDFFNTYFKDSFQRTYHFESLNHYLYHNTMKDGLQDLLRYADRNSMAHSREIRLPFLSHDLVNFIFSLPAEYKIHDGWTKWIMRESFSSLLPAEIGWRKDKIGFEPPQKDWMENEKIHEKISMKRNDLINQRLLSNKLFNVKIKSEMTTSSGINWKLLSI